MNYSTGTANVVTGSYSVTGIGTTWTSLTPPFMFSITAGETYEVTRVVDNTTLWLAELYRGTTASAQTYMISNAFIPFYNFPVTNDKDARQAETLTDYLLKTEKQLVTEGHVSEDVVGYRGQLYTLGGAVAVEGDSSVHGYYTVWTDIPELSTTDYTFSGGHEVYFSTRYFPTSYPYFPTAYFPSTGITATPVTSTNAVYFKLLGDYDIYNIDSIDDADSLTLASSFSPADSFVNVYNDATTYYPGDLVSYDSSLWYQYYNEEIVGEPPIVDWDATTYYSYGNVVLDSSVRYLYIASDSTSGILTSDTDYWTTKILYTDLLRHNTYWKLFTGYSYQIMYSTTENLGLPLPVTGTLEYWDWFRKALELLDESLS